MFSKFTLPATPKAKKIGVNKDNFLLCQSSYVADLCATLPMDDAHCSRRDVETERSPWHGGKLFSEILDCCRNGDLSAVAESDKLLEKLDMFPAPTSRHTYLDDVVGGFPNVPAFIAGQPLNMRRRVKQENEFQPIGVVVNLFASCMIPVEDVRKRGIAVLALVRAIAARRPVELWVGLSTTHGKPGRGKSDKEKDTDNFYFQIETSPLDLARAAYFIADPSVLRVLTFDVVRHHWDTYPSIPVLHSNMDRMRSHYHATVAHAFPHLTDVIAVPGLHGQDPAVTDPLAWIAGHVHHATLETAEAEAA